MASRLLLTCDDVHLAAHEAQVLHEHSCAARPGPGFCSKSSGASAGARSHAQAASALGGSSSGQICPTLMRARLPAGQGTATAQCSAGVPGRALAYSGALTPRACGGHARSMRMFCCTVLAAASAYANCVAIKTPSY
jgi:hypothetical protein